MSELKATRGPWFAWPEQTDFEQLEVEILFREGTTFKTNAADFDFWEWERRSDMCDDVIAFRVVGLEALSEDDAHRLTGEWQERHGFIDAAATYGQVEAIARARGEAA